MKTVTEDIGAQSSFKGIKFKNIKTGVCGLIAFSSVLLSANPVKKSSNNIFLNNTLELRVLNTEAVEKIEDTVVKTQERDRENKTTINNTDQVTKINKFKKLIGVALGGILFSGILAMGVMSNFFSLTKVNLKYLKLDFNKIKINSGKLKISLLKTVHKDLDIIFKFTTNLIFKKAALLTNRNYSFLTFKKKNFDKVSNELNVLNRKIFTPNFNGEQKKSNNFYVALISEKGVPDILSVTPKRDEGKEFKTVLTRISLSEDEIIAINSVFNEYLILEILNIDQQIIQIGDKYIKLKEFSEICFYKSLVSCFDLKSSNFQGRLAETIYSALTTQDIEPSKKLILLNSFYLAQIKRFSNLIKEEYDLELKNDLLIEYKQPA